MMSRFSVAFFLVCLLAVVVPAQGQEDYVRFQIADKPGQYLHVEKAEPEFGAVEPGWLSARWQMRMMGRRGNQCVIRNLWTGRYLSMAGGKLTTVADPKIDPKTGEGPDVWVVARDAKDPSLATLSLPGRQGQIPQKLRIELPIAPPAAPEYPKLESTDYVRLQLSEKPDQYLHVETDTPAFGAAAPGWISARWELHPVVRGQQLYAVRSLWTGRYLTMANGKLTTVADITLDPKTGQGPDLWKIVREAKDPALVTMTHVGSNTRMPLPIKSMVRLEAPVIQAPVVQVVYHRLQSAATPTIYVHIEKGPPAAGEIKAGWYSAQWEVADRATRDGRFVTFKNRWTNAYLMVKDGKLVMGDATVDPRTGRGPHIWQATGQGRDPSQLALKHVESGLYLQFGKAKASGDGYDLNLVQGMPGSGWRLELVK